MHEIVILLRSFDPFRNHLQAEILGHVQQVVDDTLGSPVCQRVSHHGAVELHGVDGMFGQIGKGREADAEVIERQARTLERQELECKPININELSD